MFLLAAAGLSIGWIVAEFRGARWMRILLGITSILTACAWGLFSMEMERHAADVRHGEVVRDLVVQTLRELENGHHERVIREMSKLYRTYENFGTDRHLIYLKETADRLGNPSIDRPDPRE